MGFLKKLFEGIFGGEGQIRDRDGIYIYVQCDKCGAPVRVRADKHHDLQRDLEHGGYVLRKEIMDGTCFQLMYATLHFDAAYNVVDREIEGGEFITHEEYQEMTTPAAEETA